MKLNAFYGLSPQKWLNCRKPSLKLNVGLEDNLGATFKVAFKCLASKSITISPSLSKQVDVVVAGVLSKANQKPRDDINSVF